MSNISGGRLRLDEFLLEILDNDPATTRELQEAVRAHHPNDAPKVYGRLRSLERRQLVGRIKDPSVSHHVLWHAR